MRFKNGLSPALLAVAVFFAPGAAAADPTASPPFTRMNFESFRHAQGLGNQTVSLLLQDRDGFIWAATDRGLYRYNGDRFELFGADRGLPEPRVTALCLDSDGGLWAGTAGRLARFRDGTFVTVGSGLPSDCAVADIAAGLEGELWVATNRGLFAGTEAGGFKAVPGWTDASAKAVIRAPKSGRVWAVGDNDLWRLNPGGQWMVIDPGGAASRDGLERPFEDDQGRVWIRSVNALWKLGPGSSRPQKVGELYRSENEISRMYQDPDGVLWAPNETGLARLENGHWTQWQSVDGLPSDFSRAALVDHEGSLWVGGLGLFRIIGRGSWRTASPQEGLPAPVWSILRTGDGRLWAGTQKGLARAASRGWNVIPGTDSLRVRSLAGSPGGVIFLAGEPARILAWDPKMERLSVLPGLPLKCSLIYTLFLEGEDRLWIGTYESGLMSARKSGEDWRIEAEPLPGGSAKESVYRILRDRSGRLWAGGDRGLACFSGGRWTRYTRKDGLLDDGVTFVVEAPSGDLWVAYYDRFGVSRVRAENGRIRVLQTIGPQEGLSSANIFLVGFDAKGRLWVGSDRGTDVFDDPDSASPRAIHYGIEEGLPDEDIASMAFQADPNGDVWIGTRSGMGQYIAALDGGSPPPPRTEILRASIGGSPVPAGPRPPVRVPYDRNELGVEFAALSFIYSGAVEHQVRLAGLEDRWAPAPGHEIRYPGLAPGSYRLEIRSRTGQGNWGPSASLAFVILPPLWKTLYARIGIGIALLGLFYLVMTLRTRSLKARAKRLEADVRSRTAELDARSQELASANESLRNLSVTDALTGVRNRRYLALTMPESLAQVDRAHNRPSKGPEAGPANIDMMLAMLDMDHFKLVNDDYGHDAGDRVLTQIASVLRTVVRDTDTIARWGGEEFLLVLRNMSRSEGRMIAERIRSRVATHRFDLGGGRIIHCTCSIGFAHYPIVSGCPRSFAWESVVEIADRCLLAAKRSGRNTWVGVLASEAEDPDLFMRLLPADLEDLVQKGLLQAITNLRDPGEIRWGPIR